MSGPKPHTDAHVPSRVRLYSHRHLQMSPTKQQPLQVSITLVPTPSQQPMPQLSIIPTPPRCLTGDAVSQGGQTPESSLSCDNPTAGA